MSHWRWLNALHVRRADGVVVKRITNNLWQGFKDGASLGVATSSYMKAMSLIDKRFPMEDECAT